MINPRSKQFILKVFTICVISNFAFLNAQNNFKPGNPLVADVGMADPHIRIFNSKAYLYATRDEDKTAKTFVMPDWRIWSSNDLIHWKLETIIDPSQTYMGTSKQCWAPDAETKNGNYYFYFSNGNVDTGVMVGKTPVGPFKDALGKPMLPKDLTSIKEYDPTILIDDDAEKSAYIAFGHHRSNDKDFYYCIAKMNDDMISLAEKPREIEILGDSEILKGNDKPTLHKHNGIYYLSAGSHYATATNIYGPYTKIGNSGNDNYGLDSKAHGNYFDWNNQSFHTWCHFHLGKDVARYRESYITYLHYKNNGEMVSDTKLLNEHFDFGVGQYDANWKEIEAEWYMSASNIAKREANTEGFEIQKINKNSFLFFPNIYNLKDKKEIIFNVSSVNSGRIIVLANNKNGEIVGKCKIPNSGGFESSVEVHCKLKSMEKVNNIYLQFKGKGDDFLHLDTFYFK